MRLNEPVTQREHTFDPNSTLMSTTDLKGRIIFANAAFVEASGFSREELLGQPHNLVRHPDMPAEAFADMWSTLQSGHSWTAVVKNRRQNGDHYWVRANVTPVLRNGQPAGYLSVRTSPTRAEVESAERLYQRFREGRARGLAFHKGTIVHTGWRAWTSLHKTLGLAARVRLPVLGLGLMAGGACAATVDPGLPLWSGLAGIAAATAGAWAWLETQVVKPLKTLATHAQLVASGQTDALQMDRVDELGLALRAVNQLGLTFRWIVDDVASQVDGVRVASEEIARGNDDLSERTEQTSARLQESASSMEQMSSIVSTNADASRRATDLAGDATEAAGVGGRSVHRLEHTMQRIAQEGQRIGEIIGVIDGIAFQTNILALNAAVEAARAGEQGRGFAVVAGEVRTLAQRSANAAREIKTLIGASAERIDEGVREVGEAKRTIDDMVGQVNRVNALIAEISHATAEQSTGISQVNEAVSAIDHSTQENAALVEQSAAAAASLRHQASELASAVGVFSR
jgi:aerotaxis receptor